MMTKNKTQFSNLSRLYNDSCYKETRDNQNQKINNLVISNYNTANCDFSKLKQFSTSEPNIFYKDGFGFTNNCNVDNDSDLRLGSQMTQWKCRNQLKTRVYQAVPFRGRGCTMPVTEIKLQTGENTFQNKSCNTLADIHIDRFTPMLNCTQEIQKPNHVIYDWTRGGDPSRQLVKNKEYLENCGYKKSF
jgi:hypothetical protein